MSGFVTTGLAWAALALASIPIIIHLLNRRKLLRMDWAAMEFLLAALKKTRRKLRLEHLLLLLLRTLMMILLGLFLARPMLSDTEYSWLAGALKNEEKIFILD
ncbi:MAG: BatA domain-containing protein, partial [Planctomycetota bacterium]|nr:BatA domain-containing protein [Planctomycetota bacterium]